ncbi:hypothetical protein LCGC14_0377830 [marine sediment metagenome]|uniref:Uncharacterized protein n=1 Tax=marine sediment metagenome TaxID=412755 RepID=A0A0F9T2Z7_9ZZZZ
MKIIGISGKKQSGKSFLAKNLCEIIGNGSQRDGLARGCNYDIICMADALKQIVIDCFVPPQFDADMSPLTLNSDASKNLELPCGHTIRYLLQQIGTEMFRGLWSDVWLNAWKRKVSDAKCNNSVSGRPVKVIICPDVRFPNELKAIHDLGGVVIRLTRAPFADVDQHESETALDGVKLKQKCIRCNGEGYCERYDRGAPFDGPCNICNGDKIVNKGGFDFVMNNENFSMDDARCWAKDFVAENYPDYV